RDLDRDGCVRERLPRTLGGVKSLALAGVCLAALLASGAADAARSPRSEKLAIAAADVDHARQGLIRLADLAVGWQAVPPVWSRGDGPQCPWQASSALTTTADETADFVTRGAHLESRVEELATHADALAVFRIDTKPGTAECLGKELQRALRPTGKLASARVVRGPTIGERTVRFRWTLRVGATVLDFVGVEFVRGRTVGSVVAYLVGQQ